MRLWTSKEAETATGGHSTFEWQATGVSIDTRTIRPGDLFVALKNVRDGHEFAAEAMRKGASAAMVSRIPGNVKRNAPLLVVDDVLAALQDLGKAARDRSAARVVAVTGSVGKTSTKEMLRVVLEGHGSTHVAEASYNNHWGVPLTLARMPADVRFAVVELGMNHPGEIEPLALMARPHVAIVTAIAPAHLEAFDNIDGIAHEKASMFRGLENGGSAVVNGDPPASEILARAAREATDRVVTFGTSPGNHHRLDRVDVMENVTIGHARAWRTPILYKVAAPGRHFAMNALGVIAAVRELGCDRAMAIADLVRWQPPSGRGTREILGLDKFDEEMTITLIDDAFNANPASMAAALEILAKSRPTDDLGRISQGRRIAILGDMLELGPDEISMHSGLAGLADMHALDEVHCAGPRMKSLWRVLPKSQRGEFTESAEEMAGLAPRLIDAGDVVLVKGSKGSRISIVAEALRNMASSVHGMSGEDAY
ncbi:MAG: UDP-N-acetylmuramoyl-tripeptide--D-alanyl-D-alanine ligase [Roseovarius sp.]|nr:UDP-N-acetylmuramoyl-tripeptide--D-alanyl-D-alanine ligase [Roseovarius sp.]